MTNKFLVMTLTILVLFVIPLIFAETVSASPLESFAENPIPYWTDNSAGVDVSWDSAAQTVTLANLSSDEGGMSDTYLDETFEDVDEWEENPVYPGIESFSSNGNDLIMKMHSEGANDNEAIMRTGLDIDFDAGTYFEFKYKTNITFTDYVSVRFYSGANSRTFSLGSSVTWVLHRALVKSGTLGGVDFSNIDKITIGIRLDSGLGDVELTVAYEVIGEPDLDLRVPIMRQATQSIELMGNFSGLNSTVRFQFYDNNSASGLWCDVTDQNVTFPDASYAEFTDVARINFTLNEEIRISEIYIYAQNMTLIDYYSDYIGLANNDYLWMNDSAFEGSFQLWYLQGDVAYLEEINDMTGDLFYELFLSLEMWGYFGPLALVVIGYFISKKERGLGIFFIIVDSLIIATYLTLVEATPQYWWHVFILILGVMQCTFRLVGR